MPHGIAEIFTANTRHVIDTGQDLRINKPGILLASLQQQAEHRKLLCACIKVNTYQVILENTLDCLSRRTTFVHIERIQHIEEFIEDMSRTACKIGHLQGFQFRIPVYRIGCGRRINQILPVLRQITTGVVIQVNATKGVLDHVFHNPVRRKYLGCGRDILGFGLFLVLKAGKHLILLFGYVELV